MATQDGTEEAPEMEIARWEAQDQVRELNALFANRIFVQPDGLHLRISFGERIGDEARYHTSIVVPNADALEFGQLVFNMATASLDNQIEYYRRIIAELDAQKAEQTSASE